MHYIVFDLEFNQDFASIKSLDESIKKYPYEIIQIGAVKLDQNFKTLATFNRYVKPSIYEQISAFVTDLTGITTEQLASEDYFPGVFNAFTEFIGKEDAVFCIWGMSDMKELFRNVEYHKLDKELLPIMYINLQPYVSLHFNLPKTKLLKLQTAVEMLNIPVSHPFHDAFHDAYYTAELLKKIHHPAILPKQYTKNYVNIQSRLPKKVIDFEGLFQQFNKMYGRELSNDEQNMIKLAYLMGKTNQFLK